MPITVATGPDHIVLRVQDPVKSVQWYSDTLGLQPVRLEKYQAGERAVLSCANFVTAVEYWWQVYCYGILWTYDETA
jgi:catechol 2,3-dioxygenase-like lactoylglutathione lyase family enzyme